MTAKVLVLQFSPGPPWKEAREGAAQRPAILHSSSNELKRLGGGACMRREQPEPRSDRHHSRI